MHISLLPDLLKVLEERFSLYQLAFAFFLGDPKKQKLLLKTVFKLFNLSRLNMLNLLTILIYKDRDVGRRLTKTLDFLLYDISDTRIRTTLLCKVLNTEVLCFPSIKPRGPDGTCTHLGSFEPIRFCRPLHNY